MKSGIKPIAPNQFCVVIPQVRIATPAANRIILSADPTLFVISSFRPIEKYSESLGTVLPLTLVRESGGMVSSEVARGQRNSFRRNLAKWRCLQGVTAVVLTARPQPRRSTSQRRRAHCVAAHRTTDRRRIEAVAPTGCCHPGHHGEGMLGRF